MNATGLLVSSTWLTLATVGADGAPHASYVPFVPIPQGLGIAVSSLAMHTGNLLAQPAACGLIVWGEPVPDGDFARPRLSIDVVAHRAESASAQAATIWSALETRHGAIAPTLRALPDFVAFVLEPIAARLILGFAAAHDLGPAEIRALVHAAYDLMTSR